MKVMKRVLVFSLAILAIAITGCSEEHEPIKTIKINVCSYDPENADLWVQTGINLFDRPGGLSSGAKFVGKIPACDGINVDVLEIKEVNGLVYYKIRYGDLEGWQTKRLLTGKE